MNAAIEKSVTAYVLFYSIKFSESYFCLDCLKPVKIKTYTTSESHKGNPKDCRSRNLKVIGVKNDEKAVKIAQTDLGMAKREEKAETGESITKFHKQLDGSQSRELGKAN